MAQIIGKKSQNQFRKYYIDTYLDLQHKEDEDIIAEGNSVNKKPIVNQKPQNSLTVEYKEVENIDRRETSTKDAVLKIQDYKRELFRKQFEESKKQ